MGIEECDVVAGEREVLRVVVMGSRAMMETAWSLSEVKVHIADGFQINRPHVAYCILGGFTSIFMLVSLFIKERLYIGEASE